MKIGKTYIINPECKAIFANECPQNADMLALIELHGPSFVVKDMNTDYDDDKCVTRVTMRDGTEFGFDGKPGSYFELYDDEFKHFIEVSPESISKQSLIFEVTTENARDVIAEIKEIFGIK
ncbi:hypothetical protein lh_250 [Escherichia phage LH01]|uniref:Phage protein n=1 Tax=Escherichia phage FP43 TaxID=2666261 RepID=A0A650EZX5_9CAUD|nr:hypothetical protein [Escherichia coli]QGT55345.1 hypothetical protein [Escherichia phage FP43]